MSSLLHDLLLDAGARCQQARKRLDDLAGSLPVEAEAHRARWSGLVGRYEAAIGKLAADPDLQDPHLAQNFYIQYKQMMRFLMEVEAGPLVVLGRFGTGDLYLTRIVARICSEIGYSSASPLASTSSSHYYGALPSMDIVILPPLEEAHLLGLVDLYHELGHFVLARQAQQLVNPFLPTIDRVFDELVQDATRRNATKPELEAIERSRAAWKQCWYEEFAADLLATYWAGPAFGWANVRLCSNMSPALFVGGLTHPADAARHQAITLMLRAQSFKDEAEAIEKWWQELVGLSRDTSPTDFDLTYPPRLFDELCRFLSAECSKLGFVAWQASGSHNPNVGRLLNEAWEKFRAEPVSFPSWERSAVSKLRADLGVT